MKGIVMTPYNHIWGWATSLHVDQMDAFIAKHSKNPTGSLVITYKGDMKTHTVGDILETVKYCREEYRKDQRMTNQEGVMNDG
jgi:hypothetical protein